MKNTLRNAHKQSRDSIEGRGEKSILIKKTLFSLPEFQKAGTILFYSSIKSEVETMTMIETALLLGKRVVLPAINKSSQALDLFEVKSISELSKGVFGIPEPQKIFPVEKEEIELAVLPGIVFDRRGYRIGYGYGYYDRLLKDLKIPRIGIAFEPQIIDAIPSEPHDVPVNKIISENRIINCISEL